MRQKYVEQPGEVVEVTPSFVTVRFLNKSACASCHAKGICSAGDEKTEFVEVPNTWGESYEKGDRVRIRMVPSMGFKAVWISYVIPLCILMILLLSLSSLNLNELFVGLVAIVSVTAYYLIIYLFRNKIADKFVFTIVKNY